MTYDLTLRSDSRYQDQRVASDIVSCLKRHLSDISPNGSDGWVLRAAEDDPVELDVELVSHDGDWIDPTSNPFRNCIRVHISNEAAIPEVVAACHTLARCLGWRVFDEQTGGYLDT